MVDSGRVQFFWGGITGHLPHSSLENPVNPTPSIQPSTQRHQDNYHSFLQRKDRKILKLSWGRYFV